MSTSLFIVERLQNESDMCRNETAEDIAILLDEASALILSQIDRIEKLRAALTELRDRIKEHPAYAPLTEEEEINVGGDTAEFSYLVRVADEAIGNE